MAVIFTLLDSQPRAAATPSVKASFMMGFVASFTLQLMIENGKVASIALTSFCCFAAVNPSAVGIGVGDGEGGAVFARCCTTTNLLLSNCGSSVTNTGISGIVGFGVGSAAILVGAVVGGAVILVQVWPVCGALQPAEHQ